MAEARGKDQVAAFRDKLVGRLNDRRVVLRDVKLVDDLLILEAKGRFHLFRAIVVVVGVAHVGRVGDMDEADLHVGIIDALSFHMDGAERCADHIRKSKLLDFLLAVVIRGRSGLAARYEAECHDKAKNRRDDFPHFCNPPYYCCFILSPVKGIATVSAAAEACGTKMPERSSRHAQAKAKGIRIPFARRAFAGLPRKKQAHARNS